MSKLQKNPAPITEAQNTTDEVLFDLEEQAVKIRSFWDHYGKKIAIAVGVVSAAILLYFAYKIFIVDANDKVAQEKIFMAERAFEQDSFALALAGQQGSYAGMSEIIKKYGGTPTGNLAKFYAGVSALQSGSFDDAIKNLKDFSGKGAIIPALALGALGDAYSEKNDMESALKYYKQAADHDDNMFTAPLFLWKTGMLLDHQGKTAEALELFKKIQKDFPLSLQGKDIDVDIARLSK